MRAVQVRRIPGMEADVATSIEQLRRLVRRRGALAAAFTALGVGVLLIAQDVVRTLIQLIGIGTAYGLDELRYIGPSMTGLTFSLLTTTLPFAVGFFLSLWLLAPIVGELRLRHVIARAVLATGVGATLWFVAQAVVALVRSVAFHGAIFANSFPSPSFDGGSAVAGLVGALTSALTAFVTLLPLGVLAGVLLWQWRKAHPAEFDVAGILDV